jgi:NAD-dependent SIR2 family protein deacetylase
MIEDAAARVKDATALIVAAGAGMGVDSGLPDFRGPEGFWRAYPPYRHLGLAFEDMANPRWFVDDPALAWGFYGHRKNLYADTTPHNGFTILRRWSARMEHGAFVFTSNVDGAFQKAGFTRVAEVHGSIGLMQCTQPSCRGLWRSDVRVDVDEATFRARAPLPTCPRCRAIARPNILMFGDFGWDESHAETQQEELDAWLRSIELRRAVVIECGAGTAIPSVRRFSERLAARGASLVRINVREPDVPVGQIGIAMGARAALEQIDAHLSTG